jgi:cytochrome c oxidase subunit 1
VEGREVSSSTSFTRKYLFTIDHKMIGRQYLWTGLAALALGGTLAMLIRWQWGYPGAPVPLIGQALFGGDGAVTPAAYASLFTTHGLVMIFFAITPILIGAFGNFLIPLQIGARDMAFPRLNAWSYWTYLVSLLVMLASFLVPLGTASAGWTSYPPLSTSISAPGVGQTLVLLALLINGASSTMGAINYVTTVLRERAPGMTWFRLPLTTWGLWLTAVLNLLFVPVLAAATFLLLLDRVVGTQFFVAGAAVGSASGDPVLYQHLFWIFGHPEVYILILPAWGILGDVISFFARKPAHWYRGSVLSMIAVTALSGTVYAHHMFVAGIQPLIGKAFMATSLLISLPAEVLALNWIWTMWKGAIRLTSPMVCALGTVFVFCVGGLTGLYLGTIATDLYLHDTMWVVGHFHLIMAAATFLASFAAIYFWYPKIFGRKMDETLGKLHGFLSTVLLFLVFGGQLIAGYSGQPRRLYDPYQYAFVKPLLELNRWTSVLAFALGAVQLLFVYNFIASLWRGEPAGENPWQVGTLEWTVASPPPEHNFEEVPTVVRGPHAFAARELSAAIGRDWASQSEALPAGVEVQG